MDESDIHRRRGRPSMGAKAKKALSLRLDPEVIESFKAGGPGWQTRMNNYLAAEPAIKQIAVTFIDRSRALDDIMTGLEATTPEAQAALDGARASNERARAAAMRVVARAP